MTDDRAAPSLSDRRLRSWGQGHRRLIPSAGLAVLLLLACFFCASLLLRGSSPAEAAPPAPRPARFVGVNIATGGFAADHIPGVYGQNYVYPDRATAAPFLAAGMTAIRMPFLWERVQPVAFGPLDRTEMERIDQAVAELGGFDMVILDVHNYVAYRGVRLDQPGASGAMLADLWTKLAKRYGGSPKLAFGIMNEPNGIDARAWRTIADQTVAAIRATGAKNLILVPGTRWSGAHSWLEGGEASNAAAFAGFRDPGNNFVFELHIYLDADSSGMHANCVNAAIGAQRLEAVTRWLRDNHYRGFLGEFGVDRSPVCLAALDNMLSLMDHNPDAWLGWTYWAAGGWWGDYMFNVQPDAKGPKPQFAILARHLPPRR